MLSSSPSSRCCAAGVFLVPSLLLLPLLLSLIHTSHGATLREHRLSGTEPVSYGPPSQMHPPPSAEMLRALRYIQSLSESTPADPNQSDQDAEDDMESVRSMLKMASPTRREEKDNTQELLQAVLTTLQQTEEHMKTPQKVIATPRYHQFARPKQQVMVDTDDENYGRNSWANTENRRRYREYPTMFEDDQPLKRTNEKVEEQYTPQKLATLQSVFEELSGIASSKTNTKGNDDDDDDDEDLYRQRKMVLEDIMGTDDWTPLEEQMESEEEERERHGFTRNLEDDDEDDDVKRSLQSDWLQTRKEEEEPEDMAKLVDYYLLQMLEKKEQEQQKRQEDDEEEEVEKKDEEKENVEEREVKPMQSLSEVLKISQKLRIPPEELLELLRNENRKDLPGRTGYINAHKTFASAPHQRPIETSDITQDILSILELASAAQQNQKRPTQAKNEHYYERQASRDDYDDTAGEEDELANYLASEMQRHTRMMPLRDEDQPANLQNYYEKQPVEHENAATGIDNSTMMKILRLLDPEIDDADETDSDAGEKVPEM